MKTITRVAFIGLDPRVVGPSRPPGTQHSKRLTERQSLIENALYFFSYQVFPVYCYNLSIFLDFKFSLLQLLLFIYLFIYKQENRI